MPAVTRTGDRNARDWSYRRTTKSSIPTIVPGQTSTSSKHSCTPAASPEIETPLPNSSSEASAAETPALPRVAPQSICPCDQLSMFSRILMVGSAKASGCTCMMLHPVVSPGSNHIETAESDISRNLSGWSRLTLWPIDHLLGNRRDARHAVLVVDLDREIDVLRHTLAESRLLLGAPILPGLVGVGDRSIRPVWRLVLVSSPGARLELVVALLDLAGLAPAFLVADEVGLDPTLHRVLHGLLPDALDGREDLLGRRTPATILCHRDGVVDHRPFTRVGEVRRHLDIDQMLLGHDVGHVELHSAVPPSSSQTSVSTSISTFSTAAWRRADPIRRSSIS